MADVMPTSKYCIHRARFRSYGVVLYSSSHTSLNPSSDINFTQAPARNMVHEDGRLGLLADQHTFAVSFVLLSVQAWPCSSPQLAMLCVQYLTVL